MTNTAVVAMMAVESGTNAQVCKAFTREVRLPKLKRRVPVVLDNLGAHRRLEVRAVLEEAGIRLRCMSPYSQGPNPIELRWHCLKNRLLTPRARVHQTIDSALVVAMEARPQDIARNSVQYLGYSANSP